MKTIWDRQLLARRPGLGQYARLIDELKQEDTNGFFNILRMGYQIYEEILIL
ncbi:hypothetical protein DPMN_189933 [Dreissena polymorpha]|uniref:Uncharacterized protein n=1 Tax=Dreissena polymorpha TaxID=45954 RepID=A0A9D4ICU5_DREPO|nr:hypothetical protein DPMN_189933 [Dreissena polymorpha]